MALVHKKIYVKKVRRAFLNRLPTHDQDDKDDYKHPSSSTLILNPIAHSLPGREDIVLYPTLGLVEMARKVRSDHPFQNIYQRVASINTYRQGKSKSVTLDLQMNQNYCKKPWQYVVNRLESYGDLDFAVWAKKIRTYNENYTKAMENFSNSFRCTDPLPLQTLKKERLKARLSRQEIENEGVKYTSSTLFASHNSLDLLSLTYTEEFLKELGYTTESLAAYARERGIPPIVDRDSPVNLALCSIILESSFDGFKACCPEAEFVTKIVKADGTLKKVVLKSVGFMEPCSEGIFMHFYYILQDCDCEDDEISTENESLKSYKSETDSDEN